MFGELTKEQFLTEYWQKKPLVIRNAFKLEEPPISAEELAGLACEVEDSARIIQEHHSDGPWKVSYGPFEDEDFTSLPESHWTLLVTDCEKHLPELQSLVEPFRFIPDWRIDDLMISYAADSGTVGPHVDQYDVFLIQLEGQREWRVGGQASSDDCIPDLELNILQQFEPDDTWVLEPGDMLYLPPGISHHGIARGACMTGSIGFRAPSHAEIMQAWLEHVVMQIPEDLRMTDPQLQLQPDSAELRTDAVENFRSIIDSHLQTANKDFKIWLGGFLSEANQEEIFAEQELTLEDFLSELEKPLTAINQNPYSRFSWQQDEAQIILSVNGDSWPLPAELQHDISLLCTRNHLPANELTQLAIPEWRDLLYDLHATGAIELSWPD